MASPAATLHSMLERLSAEDGLLPLLQQLIDQTCALLHASEGSVGLHDPAAGVMRVAAVHGRPAALCGAEFAAGTGLPGQVLAQGSTLHGRLDEFSPKTTGDRAVQRVIGCPMRWRGALIGWLDLCLPELDGERLRTVLAMLEHICRHAAVLLHHTEVYARERHRTARFELIARIASIIGADMDIDALLQRAADTIHETLGFPAVDIPQILPGDPQHLVIRIRGGRYKRAIQHTDHLHIDSGIMGAAVRERRPQLVNDVAKDPRYVKPPNVHTPKAELAVPILLGQQVAGVINVESDHLLGPLDVSSLEIIAEFLAVAIQNARLFAEARQLALLRERHRIARTLHDRVAETLSNIHLLSAGLADAWRQDPDTARARSQKIRLMAQAGITDMQLLLRELGPSAENASR